MSNRDRYTEHRIRGSLEHHAGRRCDDEVVDRYAHDVYHQDRGVFFTREQLSAMPWQSRDLIESEARRIYGRRR